MPGRTFQSRRLRLARTLRGLRQRELAEAVEVSPAAISQFESGSATPRADTLERLALKLGCTLEFFMRPLAIEAKGEPFFRSRRSTPKRERDRAKAYATAIAEIAGLLEEWVELPPPTLTAPLIPLPEDAHLDRVECAAAELRTAWNLPPGPVPNVVRLLEARGVLVAAVGEFDRVDAFTIRTSPRPVVVLCSDRGSAARRRFDAAHELAHLVLHEQPSEANQRQEKQAHRFAAALLMPQEGVQPWLPTRANQLDLLEDGSAVWGVSMQALLFRARTLGTLTEDAYSRTMRRMSAAGWRTKEPVEIGPAEVPELLRLAVDALPAAGSSLRAVASSFGVPLERLKRMLRLPEESGDGGELAALDAQAASA